MADDRYCGDSFIAYIGRKSFNYNEISYTDAYSYTILSHVTCVCMRFCTATITGIAREHTDLIFDGQIDRAMRYM